MSSHFNYEIEERNMRNQLKEMEVSFKEEAWLNYEAYAKQFQSVHKTQLLPNFNFALNRTVILPVVFGGIIILFSFLLFNFINIKNIKTTAKTSAPEMKANLDAVTEKPKTEPQKQIITPVKKEEPKQEIITNTVAAQPTINTANMVAKTLPATTSATFETSSAVTNQVVQDTQLSKTTPTYTFEPKRKRRKKADAEVLESIATPVSLPTVTQEEAEPELR